MSALATSITVTYMPHAKILLAGLIARAAKAIGETESNATVSPILTSPQIFSPLFKVIFSIDSIPFI